MPSNPPLPPVSSRFSGVGSSPVRDLLALTERPEVISFAGGLPAPELFDLPGLRASFAAALTEPGALQYSMTEGNRELRRFIAERYTAQGLPTTGDEVIITTGSQQGLTLIATAMIEPGDTILVERPSYLAALQTFSIAGARIVGVPVDERGIDLSAVDRLAREHRPKLIYTVPTFQNPTGRSHGVEARRGLVRLAREHGFRIVEDEPYRELRYSGDPLPYLAGFDDDTVITTGSFSKVLAPGLRVGWIRTRPSSRAALVIAKQASDLHTSTVDQAAAAHYLQTGALEPALERLRDAYRGRRDAMLQALPDALPAGSTWSTPDGGMFIWVTLPAGWDSAGSLADAIKALVAYVPGAPFYSEDPDGRTLRLSFTTYRPDEIVEGIRRLGSALNR
jgi:2-aminoadipate transaminase